MQDAKINKEQVYQDNEWEQMGQDNTLIVFHSGDGGYYYVNPIEETIYCREIYAHERAEDSESSYFHPAYSSASDGTMFAPGGTDESGKRLYDVYYGKELLYFRVCTEMLSERVAFHLLNFYR